MKYQPNRDYKSNDEVQTPPVLANLIVHHFKPRGHILEPCSGDGNFYRAIGKGCPLGVVFQCEIKNGTDFFEVKLEPKEDCFDWIMTNPPWSQIRKFLCHSMTLADNIVFLMTANHAFTKARLRDVHQAGFSIVEILLLDTPPEFPQSGFQLAAIHFKRGCFKKITLSR